MPNWPLRRGGRVEVSEMASAKTASAIVSVSTTCGRFWNSVSASLLERVLLGFASPCGFRGRYWIPYWVRIVDRGVDCRDLPWPSSPCFFRFPCFFVFRLPLLFCAPRISLKPKDWKNSRLPSGIDIFNRDWKFQASHPPKSLFLWGILKVRDWKFQARLKFSIEIESFNRDWFFSIVGPLGFRGSAKRKTLSFFGVSLAFFEEARVGGSGLFAATVSDSQSEADSRVGSGGVCA